MLKNEEIRQKYPFFTKGLNYFETEWITCGCICTVRKEEWKDYCDFADIPRTGGYHFIAACQGCFNCNQLQIHTSWPTTSQLLFWNVVLEILWANAVWHIKTFAIICGCFYWASSEHWESKHRLMRFYRVSPLWRQGFKRDNQMHMSSQAKSALWKFSQGKDHNCNSFMSDMSVLHKSCVSHLAKCTTLFAEF